jgi:hypothetical protein
MSSRSGAVEGRGPVGGGYVHRAWIMVGNQNHDLDEATLGGAV